MTVRFENPVTKDPCCARRKWEAVADFGHVSGLDLDLGRCAHCGAYVMAVVYNWPPNYIVLDPDDAHRFLALRDHPRELRVELKRWLDM